MRVALTGFLALGLAAPASAAAPAPTGRFERLRNQDLRVGQVAYRLSAVNAALCGSALAPQTGFVLHSIEQYALTDRDEAERSFALGDRVGVMAVIGGTPAAKAGLVAGDRLIKVNGRDLGTIGSETIPSRASVDRALAILGEEMAHGAVSLRVSGADGERDVRFVADTGCPSNVELVPGEEVNAWADGSRVMISEGLLRHCASDDDLALVIAHEMAHNLLRHRQRLAAEGVSTNRLLPPTETGSTAMRETEEEADRFAIRLAAGANYDLSGAEAFIAGLQKRVLSPPATHPALERRLALLRAAIAERRDS